MKMLQRLRKRMLVPVLLIVTFVYAMFQGGFVSWFLFYSFLPFALYALLLPYYGLQLISVTRTTNQKEYAAGEPFTATITLRRRYAFPLLYAVIEDVLPEKLAQDSARAVVFPGFRREIAFTYTCSHMPRGEHVFTRVRCRTGDVLGLAEQKVQRDVYDRFLVYPQYVNMVYRQLDTRFDQGTTSSAMQLERDASVSVGVREYKPGDRFSWIDWKSSARRSRMMTKEFEQQRSHDVVLLLDCAPSPQFEQLVTFTASLARAVLRKGAQAAFIASGTERMYVPLRAGEAHQQEIFYYLAKVKGDSSFPLSQTVAAELANVPQQVTHMLITGMLTKDVEKAAERMRGQKESVLVFVVKERGGALTGSEWAVLEMLKQRGVFVKAVYEGQYSDVFS